MWFGAFLKIGIVALTGAVILRQEWLWLLWMVVMAAYFLIQRRAPVCFQADHARDVFGGAFTCQAVLAMGAAAVTGSVGATFIALGVTMNFIVIAANDFRMPVLGSSSENPCYCETDESTRLVWLADLFPTTVTPRADFIISAGDALEVVGVWVLAAELILA